MNIPPQKPFYIYLFNYIFHMLLMGSYSYIADQKKPQQQQQEAATKIKQKGMTVFINMRWPHSLAHTAVLLLLLLAYYTYQ